MVVALWFDGELSTRRLDFFGAVFGGFRLLRFRTLGLRFVLGDFRRCLGVFGRFLGVLERLLSLGNVFKVLMGSKGLILRNTLRQPLSSCRILKFTLFSSLSSVFSVFNTPILAEISCLFRLDSLLAFEISISLSSNFVCSFWAKILSRSLDAFCCSSSDSVYCSFSENSSMILDISY